MKKITLFALSALALATVAGCKQNVVDPDEAMPVVVASTPDEESQADDVELVPVLRSARPAAKAPAKTSSAAQANPTGKVNPKNTKPETIYVETDGAQGRVWGHVTMKGDRGTGTIHDWDENTLTVSVTRHGNELYAVDQNSRQYVFKLKK